MICDFFSRGPGRDETNEDVGKTIYFSDDDMDYVPKPSNSKPVLTRRHPDRSGRRRSANADILESVGLPSTGSYQDMKTLQEGLHVDDILGRRSTCSECLKGTASMVSGNAAQAARRASKSIATVARWTKRMTPPAVNKKLQKRLQDENQPCSPSDEDLEPKKQFQEAGILPDTHSERSILLSLRIGLQTNEQWNFEATKAWKSDSLPQREDNVQALPPAQWLRQRNAFSDVAVGKKGY